MKMISRRERLSIAIAEEAVRQHLRLDKPLVANDVDLRFPNDGARYVVVDLTTPQMRGKVKPMKFTAIVAHSSMLEQDLPVQLMREHEGNMPVAEFFWSLEPPGVGLTRR